MGIVFYLYIMFVSFKDERKMTSRYLLKECLGISEIYLGKKEDSFFLNHRCSTKEIDSLNSKWFPICITHGFFSNNSRAKVFYNLTKTNEINSIIIPHNLLQNGIEESISKVFSIKPSKVEFGISAGNSSATVYSWPLEDGHVSIIRSSIFSGVILFKQSFDDFARINNLNR